LSAIEQADKVMAKENTMIHIARMQEGGHASRTPVEDTESKPLSGGGYATPMPEQSPSLTIDRIDYPAYLLNYNFQLEWYNDKAAQQIFGQQDRFSNNIEERNIFQILFNGSKARQWDGFEDILRFHLSLAKNRLPRNKLLVGNVHAMPEDMDRLMLLHDEVEAARTGPIIRADLDIPQSGDAGRMQQIYACVFREGILIVYMPASDESLLPILSRREYVIHDLLKKRHPYVTPLAVLVADLQSSVKICSELPPEEYFELINTIWSTMQPLLRKYYATCGKHVGDGMVYYFFPQPEHSHHFNALCCAQEMKEAMRDIDRQWRRRKNWLNELQLNIGMDEGEEWFGAYQSATQLELTVLGNTVNKASRLSDFARDGNIWVAKNMLVKLSAAEQESIHYGIRRRTENGQEIFLPHSYARIHDLVDLNGANNGKLHDIFDMAVTEVLDVDIKPEEKSQGN